MKNMVKAWNKVLSTFHWKGKKSEWFAWNNTFLVRAITRGYYEILTGKETINTDEEARLINEKLADQGIAKLTTQEKKDLKLYNANIRAYADLVQCCSSDKVLFQKMLTSRTKDPKRGDTKLAWDYMIKMYAGIVTTDKMKLEKWFNELKMVPGTNPDICITDRYRLGPHLLEWGKTIDDDEFILNILYKISPEYESTAEDFLRRIEEGTKIMYKNNVYKCTKKY